MAVFATDPPEGGKGGKGGAVTGNTTFAAFAGFSLAKLEKTVVPALKNTSFRRSGQLRSARRPLTPEECCLRCRRPSPILYRSRRVQFCFLSWVQHQRLPSPAALDKYVLVGYALRGGDRTLSVFLGCTQLNMLRCRVPVFRGTLTKRRSHSLQSQVGRAAQSGNVGIDA
jgi:hypothetical protein